MSPYASALSQLTAFCDHCTGNFWNLSLVRNHVR